jgi:hypothetical protein
VTGALLVAFALLLVAPAAAPAARPPACWPPGSETLTRSGHARVFEVGPRRDERKLACLFSRARAVPLDGDASLAHAPYVLRGPLLAHVLEDHESEDAQTYLRVLDLRTGAHVHSGRLVAVNSGLYADAVDDLLLRGSGGVAWTTLGYDLSTRRPPVKVLMRMDSRGRKMLDTGQDVDSLRFCGRGRICWKRAGVGRTASLL